MNGNETMDKVLDALIDEAGEIAAENIGSRFPEAPHHIFSAEHQKTMKRMFQKEQKIKK